MKQILRYGVLFLLAFSTLSCGKKEGPLYKIGMNPTWQPLNFQQSQGAINTFLSALMIDLAKEKHFKVNLFQLTDQTLLFTLNQGDVDAILTTLPSNITPPSLYDFSDVILHLGAVLIVSEDSSVKELSELEGRIISISSYDRSVLLAQRVPDAIIRQYTNPILALEALEAREVDAVLMNALLAEQLVGSIFRGRVKIVSPPLGEEAIRLVVLHGKQQKLLKSLNQFLTTLRDKDYYRELKRHFFLLPSH